MPEHKKPDSIAETGNVYSLTFGLLRLWNPEALSVCSQNNLTLKPETLATSNPESLAQYRRVGRDYPDSQKRERMKYEIKKK